MNRPCDNGILDWDDIFRISHLAALYEIKTDPDSLRNIISDPEYSKKVQQKRDELVKWMKKYDDLDNIATISNGDLKAKSYNGSVSGISVTF